YLDRDAVPRPHRRRHPWLGRGRVAREAYGVSVTRRLRGRRIAMTEPRIVSREEWLVARKAHLEKEKAFTRLRDDLARQRRELPWVRIGKGYCFEGTEGKMSFTVLFNGNNQLYGYQLQP